MTGIEDGAALAVPGTTMRPLAKTHLPPPFPVAGLEAWRRTYAPDIFGNAPKLLRVFEHLRSLCDTDCNVLVTGETGTGKELIARAVHTASARARGPLVTVNCAALPEHLIESELFGHARGAFTGAATARVGRVAAADGGTLFLDEIGELPLSQQAKILRVLQEREVVPVGESHARSVDIRLVAATHRNLDAMVENGTFREDLMYRIQVLTLEIPALRERREDIPSLIEHFIAATNARRNRHVTGVTDDAADVLCAYDWPGNIRQLENLVERMVVLRNGGEIGLDDLPPRMLERAGDIPVPSATTLPHDGIDLRDAVEQFENGLILQALERTGWNKNRAAAILRMNRTTLIEKLRKKNLSSIPPSE